MTMDERLKAAEIISNCRLPEALPYVLRLLGMAKAADVLDDSEKCMNIKKLMEEKCISDTTLSNECSVSRSAINRYRNGINIPSDEKYEEIIKVLEEM